MENQRNTLGDLNDIIFRQLDRLEAQRPSDPEAMAAEIGRAKTIQGLAGTVISNGKLVLEAARMRESVGESVAVPSMLTAGK